MKRNFFLFLLISLLLISGCTLKTENHLSPKVEREMILIEKQSESTPEPKTPYIPSSPTTPEPSDDPPTTSSSGEKYNVFSGSYTTSSGAFEKVQILKNHQINALVVEAYVHGRKWYRVYVGSFDDQTTAQYYLNSLTSSGFSDSFMIYEPPPTRQIIPSTSPTPSPQVPANPDPEKRYNLYSGSFESRTHAQARVNLLLQNHQINSVITEAYVHGRKWYRVHVGSFYDQATTQQYLQVLKNQGYKDSFVIYE